MGSLLRIVVLMSVCLAFGVTAQTLDLDKPVWEGRKLAHLARHIGTYNHEAVLNDPHVKTELQRLTGAYFERFMRIDRISPVEFHANGIVVLSGGHIHKADTERKTIAIGLYSGRMAAVLNTSEWVKVFSVDVRVTDLPSEIRQVSGLSCLDEKGVPPPNSPRFEWFRVPKQHPPSPQGR